MSLGAAPVTSVIKMGTAASPSALLSDDAWLISMPLRWKYRDSSGASVRLFTLLAEGLTVKLYRLAVEGHLRVEDEPVRLIGAAVERGAAKARAREAAARRR